MPHDFPAGADAKQREQPLGAELDDDTMIPLE